MRRISLPTVALWLAASSIGYGGSSALGPEHLGEQASPGRQSDTEAPHRPQRWDAVPAPFDLKVEYSRELFVSPVGDDYNGTGTADRPFATLERAASAATAGTRIHLSAGVYGGLGSLRRLHGTEMQPIAIVARAGVVIDGGGRDLGLHLSDPRYVVIDGLSFRNTWPHGMNVDDGGSFETPAQHVVLRNLRFQDIGKGGNNDCLKMSGVRDYWVLSSEFEGCDRGEAIDMVGCHDGVVSTNHFHDIPQHAVQTKGGSADVLIHGNLFRDVTGRSVNAGGHTGMPYFRPLGSPHEAMRIHIVANVFERPGDAPVAFVGCQNCVFANNTIIAPRSRIARVLWENTNRAPGENGFYINNLIVTHAHLVDPTSAIGFGRNTAADTVLFDANWIFAPGLRRDYPANRANDWQSRGFVVTADDPLLQAVSDGNYRLDPDSPAIGKGRTVPGGLPADYDGRTYQVPPSVGAFGQP